MEFSRAISRKPGPDFGDGITSAGLGPARYDLMMDQHRAYVRTLRHLGVEVEVLEPLQGCPDAHFVEDTAVVFAEAAVITRPGAEARRHEVQAIEPALAKHRAIHRIQPPGRIDGGDVLQLGRSFFIGLSGRTDQIGASQLGRIVEGFGYSWTTVPVASGLHLRANLNPVSDDTLLVTPEMASLDAVRQYRTIVLQDDERYAANTLLINGHLITPRGFPRVLDELGRLGLPVVELDVSEARKMDGGLTCLSLRFT
jgi:dimethylargininase